MNRYAFSTQSGKAYYCYSIPGFITDKSTDIVGRFVRHAFDINKEQAKAWETELSALIGELQQTVIDADEAAVLTLCRKAAVTLNERNRICKLNK